MPSGSLGRTWIGRLKAGDPVAAQKLWEAYLAELIRFARKKLAAAPRRVADEEDVAVSAFNSFFQGLARGRFPQLNDPDDLWRILVTVTARKAIRQRQHAGRKKRGGGKVRGESVFCRADASDERRGIEQVVGREPTPQLAVQVVEQFRQWLDCLGDDTLRQVAVLKLEGHTNQEIADQLGCSLRSIERRLRGIRAILSREEERQ